MSDHADVIREALWSLEGVFPGDYRLAALDALVAERDRWKNTAQIRYDDYMASRAEANALRDQVTSMTQSVLVIQNMRAAAEARVTELEAAIRSELAAVERWASQQNAGNAFAAQVQMWATSKLAALAAPTKEET